MKVCLRKKCQKEFEPNKPKQVFCSAKCRVYFSREEKYSNPVSQINPKSGNIVELNEKFKDVKTGTSYFNRNQKAKKTPTQEQIDNYKQKIMPEGLDKFQKLRWLRENS